LNADGNKNRRGGSSGNRPGGRSGGPSSDRGRNPKYSGRSSNRSRAGTRQRPVTQSRPPRPAPTPPDNIESPGSQKRVQLSRQTQNLTLSAWDLARTRTKQPDSPRGHIMTLRAHQQLVASFESERNIPEVDRSFLQVKEGASGSVLLIHGVSTSPGSLRELASRLYDADLNVYVLRLPDYGTPDNTISEVSWESALQQTLQCFKVLAKGGGALHVVGMGFGATLALHLALMESVSSLVLLSPAIMPRESFLQRLVVRMKLHKLGFVHNWLGWNADLMEGMDKARGRIGKIKVPIYGAQCEDDDRASPASLRILQRKARNKASRFRVYPDGGHAILANHGEQGLYQDIITFCGGRVG
jgi:esterase/lipase